MFAIKFQIKYIFLVFWAWMCRRCYEPLLVGLFYTHTFFSYGLYGVEWRETTTNPIQHKST